jgi:hypothetical protein
MSENRILDAAASDEVGYRDPEWHPPPGGVKLLLLTEGGVAVIGTWADGAGFVAWSYLPKRAVRRGEPQLSTECTTCGAIVLGVADKYAAQPSAEPIGWLSASTHEFAANSYGRPQGEDWFLVYGQPDEMPLGWDVDAQPSAEPSDSQILAEYSDTQDSEQTPEQFAVRFARAVLALRGEPSELVRAARDALAAMIDGLTPVEDGRPHHMVMQYKAALDALRRALDAGDGAGEARDAARYRWLRDRATASSVQVGTPTGIEYRTAWRVVTGGSDTSLDAAIDAAIGDAPEAKGGGR